MIGAVQTIIVCEPQVGAVASGVCPAETVQTAKQAYVFDAAYANTIDQAMEPVDAATASTVFFAAFSAVVTCFFVSRVVGSVLEMIRR